MPTCDTPPALDRIIANFHTKEARFWNSAAGDRRHRRYPRDRLCSAWAAQSIPRRFCSGTALINDGLRHPIYYSIAEDTGMIGMDWGVNFCVIGSIATERTNRVPRREALIAPPASTRAVPGVVFPVRNIPQRSVVGLVVDLRLLLFALRRLLTSVLSMRAAGRAALRVSARRHQPAGKGRDQQPA